VQPAKGHRCPACHSFLHPDPIKRKEAKLAEILRGWIIHELPNYQDLLPSDFTLDPAKLEDLTFDELTQTIFEVMDAGQRSLPFGSPTYIIPVFALGDDNSKKSEYIDHSTEGTFTKDFRKSLGAAFAVKSLIARKFKGEDAGIKLQIWDVASGSSYRWFRPGFYRQASGAILFFHHSLPQTFESLDSWVDEICAVRPKTPLVIVGLLGGSNLASPKRLVSLSEIDKFRDRHQSPYYEVDLDQKAQFIRPWEKIAELMLVKHI